MLFCKRGHRKVQIQNEMDSTCTSKQKNIVNIVKYATIIDLVMTYVSMIPIRWINSRGWVFLSNKNSNYKCRKLSVVLIRYWIVVKASLPELCLLNRRDKETIYTEQVEETFDVCEHNHQLLTYPLPSVTRDSQVNKDILEPSRPTNIWNVRSQDGCRMDLVS